METNKSGNLAFYLIEKDKSGVTTRRFFWRRGLLSLTMINVEKNKKNVQGYTFLNDSMNSCQSTRRNGIFLEWLRTKLNRGYVITRASYTVHAEG